MHIKANTSGKAPDCVVMNVTVRSMKLHGKPSRPRGISPFKGGTREEDVQAVIAEQHINLDIHQEHGQIRRSCCCSINQFASDTEEELEAMDLPHEQVSGAVCRTEVHSKGGIGGSDLANAVVAAIHDHVAARRPFLHLLPQ